MNDGDNRQIMRWCDDVQDCVVITRCWCKDVCVVCDVLQVLWRS
jgi:hypothetical protein